MPTVKRRWIRAIVTGIIVFSLGLISVDHLQGGPLGRQLRSSALKVSINTTVGQHLLFGGGILVNSTWFPFEIQSVRPSNQSKYATLKAGILTLSSKQAMPGGMYEDDSVYPLRQEAVEVPVGANNDSETRYAIA